ncbi:MAG: hypothetical protein KGI37_07150 [Alphaproteobacteria bacterium]|nr:hypothetical protein [Alphaproteobacteria bacterium]
MSKSYPSMLSWFGLVLAASLMLYHTSDRVNALSRQLDSLNAQIADAQETRHVLTADWAYLSNPARLIADIQAAHVDLQPTPPKDVITASPEIMASLLPLRGASPAAGPTTRIASAAPAIMHDVAPAPAAPAAVARVATATRRHDRVFASINSGYVNDHMVMQHSSAAQAGTGNDAIGVLIDQLTIKP